MTEPFREDEIYNDFYSFNDPNTKSKFEIFKSRLHELATTNDPFSEWRLVGTYEFDDINEGPCLCTHGEHSYDVIKYVNYLAKRINSDEKVIRVGSRCINKLPELSPDAIIFKSINNPKVKGISKEAIIRAYELGFINEYESQFSKYTKKRDSLSNKQHLVLAKIRAQISLLIAPLSRKHLESFIKEYKPNYKTLLDLYEKSIHKIPKRDIDTRLVRHFCYMLTEYFLYLRLDVFESIPPQNTSHIVNIFKNKSVTLIKGVD